MASSQKNDLNSETSYELLLKQQQLFLQWQLEQNKLAEENNQQHQQQMITKDNFQQQDSNVQSKNGKSNSKSSSPLSLQAFDDVAREQMDSASMGENQMQSQTILEPQQQQQLQQQPTCELSPILINASTAPIIKKIISKLEDLKVSDLKAELRKRNLPVSGPKHTLIERLKPFTDAVVTDSNHGLTAMNMFQDANGSSGGGAGNDLVKSLFTLATNSGQGAQFHHDQSNRINFTLATGMTSPNGTLIDKPTFIVNTGPTSTALATTSASAPVVTNLNTSLMNSAHNISGPGQCDGQFVLLTTTTTNPTNVMQQSGTSKNNVLAGGGGVVGGDNKMFDQASSSAPTIHVPIFQAATATLQPHFQILTSVPTEGRLMGPASSLVQATTTTNHKQHEAPANNTHEQSAISFLAQQGQTLITDEHGNLTLLTGTPIHLAPSPVMANNGANGVSFGTLNQPQVLYVYPSPHPLSSLRNNQAGASSGAQLVTTAAAAAAPAISNGDLGGNGFGFRANRSNSLPVPSVHPLQR